MPRKLHDIHDAILRDPEFKPRAGRTEDEAAWAVAQAKVRNMEKALPKGIANPFIGGKTQPSKEFLAEVERRWLAKPQVKKAKGAQREVDQLHDERASLRAQPTSGAAERQRRGRLRRIASRLASWEERGVNRSPFNNPMEKALWASGNVKPIKTEPGGVRKVRVNTVKKASFAPGTRVRTGPGVGLDSNKVGTVVPHSHLKTDGGGVPTNVEGAYKPVPRHHVVVRFDDGKYNTFHPGWVAREEKLMEKADEQNKLFVGPHKHKIPGLEDKRSLGHMHEEDGHAGAGRTSHTHPVKKGNYVAFLADLVKGRFKSPRLTVPDQHQLRIAQDTIKNPAKALLGGPSVEEARGIVKRLNGGGMKKAEGCGDEKDLTNRVFERNKELDPRSAPSDRDLQKAKSRLGQGRVR